MHMNYLRMKFSELSIFLWIQKCFAFSKEFSNIPLKFELLNWQKNT